MTNPRSSISDVDWRVYVIVDPEVAPGGDVDAVVEAALAAGCGVLQLRAKALDAGEVLRMARSIAERCRAAGALFVVNDRLDIALAAGADGVHLGPNDIPVADARRIAPNLVIGASAGTPQDARRRAAEGASYLGSGAVFDASPSKPDASQPRGPAELAAVVRAVDIPVVGIGGITESNIGEIGGAGAAGAAVIRAICGAADPGAAVERLRHAFERGRSE